MKTLKINGAEIECSHEIKVDASQRPTIHLTVKCGDVSSTHVMTIGAMDKTIMPELTAEHVQRDLDTFRQRCAAELEGKIRARKLAEQVE